MIGSRRLGGALHFFSFTPEHTKRSSSSNSSSIYFLLTSISIYMDEKKRREERRSGTSGTGVSKKDLYIEKTVLRVSRKDKKQQRKTTRNIARSSWTIFNEKESK